MPNQVRFRLPKDLWTERDTKRLALNTLASIKRRTMQGRDADGKAFAGYSETPIYIPFRGARLTPKGYTRKSRTGKSAFYQGGYREYKDKSRRRSQRKARDPSKMTSEVDLVLSGSLMANFIPVKVTKTRFILGLGSPVQAYGYHVNKTRRFIGLSPSEVDQMTQVIALEIKQKLQRGR
jgi:hypothetical protein